MEVELKPLFEKLSPYCHKAFEAAAGACVSRGGYEISVEDFMLQLLEDPSAELPMALRHFGVAESDLRKGLQLAIEEQNSGSTSRPVFAPLLVGLIRDAWLLASVDLGQRHISSGAVLLALLKRPAYGVSDYMDCLDGVSIETLTNQFHSVLNGSSEAPADGIDSGGVREGSALAAYCTDFTAKAKNDELDPVFCRDQEIQQIIDILSRRRKNNPIAVGEPGVGKSAVVEGLALKIINNEVPSNIKGATLLGLDLGALQAGASVKGEFEKRLNAVLDEIKESTNRVILFIDEAHTLIGTGNEAGGGDAANLLKPALARGELRCIAATTWSEYKKYFEKDAALARRFQLVQLDEPSIDDAATILRGLRSRYEDAHRVYVRDDAIQTAAEFSARYLTGRQLPDKAVDVLDTACARVNVALSSKPFSIDSREQDIKTLEREKAARERDLSMQFQEDDGPVAKIAADIESLQADIEELNTRWQKEKALVDKLLDLRQQLHGADESPQDADVPAEPLSEDELKSAIESTHEALSALQGDDALVPYEVTPDVVCKVISDWTGVPLGKMLQDESSLLTDFAGHMKTWVKGQEHATQTIGNTMRIAKTGLGNPTAPMGVFLLVGPSGVGKTETATAVAELMFGGKQSLTVVNMSEFQEKHTISRLIGSPPGYVGYGEGGYLTEAVRKRPYSVVLLDEVEKASVDVLNLFYQVFDKGVLSDGEGRDIDFTNTVLFLTSNLASDVITDAYAGNPDVAVDDVKEAIRPILAKHFKPALLGRMEVIPFAPLDNAVLGKIVENKMDKVVGRLEDSHGMAMNYDEAVVKYVADSCTDPNSGARDIDRVINRLVLPQLSNDMLTQLGDSQSATVKAEQQVTLSVDGDGQLKTTFNPAETAQG